MKIRTIYHKTRLIFILFPALLFFGCAEKQETTYQFQLLREDVTGLDFQNMPVQHSEFNVFSYMYFFNGGGVAAGDFNGDGLIDLFFTCNNQSNKLFLNKGDFKFQDITRQAGMTGQEGWTTGTCVVDINNDGLLDIYVNQIGNYKSIAGKNQLYVCAGVENGIPRFEDKAADYGLDLVGFATQAAFFDYDLDGDLDMYQLNHSLHQNGTFGQKKSFQGTLHPTSGDKLMKNEDGKFVDVTPQANINSTVVGYGLGIVTGDLNHDGWPDIYIGNDFHENDYLYINQQDGTFKEVLTESMVHTSRFSMGVDFGDINNDGQLELISLDMHPYDPYILKSSLGEDTYSIFQFKLGYGYNPQFARNNLQLNNGDGTFSEIGLFSDIYATDWSWAPLFMDFDLDGYKDLFVSNGIPRRMNDIDYANYRKSSEDIKWQTIMGMVEDKDFNTVIEKMPKIKIPNKFFRNTRDLKFEDMQQLVKGNVNSFSNGATYADLDNDGDLDIIVNNIQDEPFIYKNLTIENNQDNKHFLSIQLQGPGENINAIGATLMVFQGKEKIVYENYPTRGYQSSVALGFNVGIEDPAAVDSIIVVWPDQSYESLENPSYNQPWTIKWRPDLQIFNYNLLNQPPSYPVAFQDISENVGIDFTHKENPFVEFNREGLIPFMVSREGPAVAVGDVNGDGLEDLFLGSSKRGKSVLYLQNKGGTFNENTPSIIANDSTFEDVDAVFADVENDGDLDLVIAAGGNEYWGDSEYLQQRIYLNDGTGNFDNKMYFEDAFLTASCVLPADFNQDGLVDFFFGARAVPWNYGKKPTSYLFLNKGNNQFENVTEKLSPALSKVGLVKDGTWTDLDKDGDLDLVLAVGWEPVKIFLNENERFTEKEVGKYKGWWNFVLPHDFDGDGDVDLIAGNIGKNTKFKPTAEQPLKLYVEDFDDNGQIEQILTYFFGGKEIPFANYQELTQQLPSLKKKYLYSKDLAAASIPEIFGQEKLNTAETLEANTLESAYFENTDGALNFKMHPLPDELQFSTLESAVTFQTPEDGASHVVLGGNFYDCNIEMGMYDANYGSLLSISETNQMTVHPVGSLNISGQVRKIKSIKIGDVDCLIWVKNNDRLQIIQPVEH
ncbi:VCBS repeat-containing protein [Fulvivirgaceae bacterium BMA12]|uniref:VCBS repeat-containing protein n=1 Tax=Agaribacillus aureus TaxID=3051825 RepID=A0ABT8LG04_9BACT|nr:VCBS repeat-containing protein [Fulvivirgaceae bacterium BMA12]